MPDRLNDRPVIAMTMGDPCGIGAEIIVKALADEQLRKRARFVVFGLAEQLVYTADRLELDLPFSREHHEDVRRFPRELVLLDYDEIAMPASMPRGPSRLGGRASFGFCQDAIEAALAGEVDALVTAPIAKTSWLKAGIKKYPGHTELLAETCRSRRVAMMFVAPQLRVALATIHVSIAQLPNLLNIGSVFDPIDLTDQALKAWFGVQAPRIAVAGLNPHAGESGRFGDEEERVIAPAVLMAREGGIDAHGPFPADSLFAKAVAGQYDAVVAMYHDQGLVPVKLLAADSAVNLTLGLPIVRTSPAHGTAFDIAGKNVADPASFLAATELAIDLAGRARTGQK